MTANQVDLSLIGPSEMSAVGGRGVSAAANSSRTSDQNLEHWPLTVKAHGEHLSCVRLLKTTNLQTFP